MSVLARTAKLGVAPESVPSEYVAPTTSLVFSRRCTYRQRFTPLRDSTVRGNDAGLQDWQQGPSWSEWVIPAPCYPDAAGIALRAITGPDSCTPGVQTTLTVAANAGAQQITLDAEPPAGSPLMVGAGSDLEYVVTGTPSGSGPYLAPLTTPLQNNHGPGEQAQTPATHSLSESIGAGFPTYSLTMDDNTGPLAWPGCSATSWRLRIPLSGQAATETRWSGFPPSACDTFDYDPSPAQPYYSWAWAVNDGDEPSTRARTLDLLFSRPAGVQHAVNGQQAPLGIWPGRLTISATYTAIFDDEDDWDLYVHEVQDPVVHTLTQPQLQGGSQIAITLPRGAWTDAVPDTSGQYLAARYVTEGVATNPDGPLVAVSLTSYVQGAY